VQIQLVSLMPQTWLKGASGRMCALKRAWRDLSRGAEPVQALRMVAREYLDRRPEVRIVTTMAGT
jgi:hypothetical protein